MSEDSASTKMKEYKSPYHFPKIYEDRVMTSGGFQTQPTHTQEYLYSLLAGYRLTTVDKRLTKPLYECLSQQQCRKGPNITHFKLHLRKNNLCRAYVAVFVYITPYTGIIVKHALRNIQLSQH